MKVLAGVFCIVLLAACGTCHNNGQDRTRDNGETASQESSAAERQKSLAAGSITGTVRYVDLEGGFYGIETDEGARLDPVNLPEDFQKEGLRLRAKVERLTGRVSLRMWGTLVRIVSLERL